METRALDLFVGVDVDAALTLRAGLGEQPRRLVGYASVFNSTSQDLGGFKERISPGAFKTSTTNGFDIRALVDHDPAKLLGRMSNGTLRAHEDERGLRVEIDLPNTSYANDMLELVKRGDMRGMSFGFKVREGGQSFTREGGQAIRTLTDIDLREVSCVTVPAYAATSLQLRVDPSVLAQFQTPDEKNVSEAVHQERNRRYQLLKAQ